MRELFKNKQKAALDKAHAEGWNEGFNLGTKKAVSEAKKVFIKRIQKEIEEVSSMVDVEFLDGLNRAIDLIKRSK